MTVKQISVFVENKPGKLADLAGVLSKENINLRAISIAEAPDFGVVRIIVDDVFNAVTVLKAADYVCSITEVLAVEVKDEPGMLASMIATLGAAEINLEYMYTILGKKADVAYMIIRVNDNEKAIKILADKGIATATLENI
ncbi:MAG: ACT domain-containing protein [Clostridia bacterium]|nr:ACT domain-containing protein [Clostridia bacterium]